MPEETLAAKDAASEIGISPDLLREWSQDDMFAPFMTAPRSPKGRRYTQHDIAVCKLIKRLHQRDGRTYPQIVEHFQTHGTDQALQLAIGADQANEVLQAEANRLRNQVQELLMQTARMQETANLWQQARAVGYVAIADLEAKRAACERDIEILTVMERKARKNLDAALQDVQNAKFLSWVFGGRERMAIRLQEARESYDDIAERLQGMIESLGAMNLGRLRETLKLQAGPEPVIDLVAPAHDESKAQG